MKFFFEASTDLDDSDFAGRKSKCNSASQPCCSRRDCSQHSWLGRAKSQKSSFHVAARPEISHFCPKAAKLECGPRAAPEIENARDLRGFITSLEGKAPGGERVYKICLTS